MGEWQRNDRRAPAEVLVTTWPEVEASPDRRHVALCQPTAPTVVVGSTQSTDLFDAGRLVALGMGVATRRSGGGAVDVDADDPCWVDFWVPRGDPLFSDDVGASFAWCAQVWQRALASVGLTGLVRHSGPMVRPEGRANLACFASLGQGELTDSVGAKVVGMAQRRDRRGAWYTTAAYRRWRPERLAALADPPLDAEELGALRRRATGIEDALDRLGGRATVGREVERALFEALGVGASLT